MKKSSLKVLSIVGASIIPFAITPLIVSCSKEGEDLSNVKMYDKNHRILFNGAGTILDYDGNATELEIPEYLENNSVTSSPYYGKRIKVKYIGHDAFAWSDQEDSGRPKLQKVTLPNSITHIYNGAFFNNELTSIEIPNSVIEIDSHAFSTNKLNYVKLSNSLIEIYSYAFYRNESLNQIIIPNSVISIGIDAFGTTGIRKVVLPPNCEYLSSSFPENCIIEGGKNKS